MKSCGCLNGDAQATHRLSHTPAYTSWAALLNRCENPRNKDYDRYGARGITVCGRWHSFEAFYEDMGPKPPGLTIGRIDNDGPYSPANCRWETQATQARNRRNSVFVVVGGQRMNATEAASRLGMDRGNFYHAAKRYGSYQAAADHFAKRLA